MPRISAPHPSFEVAGPLIRLRAFTERPDPPSPTRGEGRHAWRPAVAPSLLPSWEKVSAKLTDEGALGLRVRGLLKLAHTLRFSPEIRASTAFAASNTLEPAPGSGSSSVFRSGKAPHPSPGVHGTLGSTFSHKGEGRVAIAGSGACIESRRVAQRPSVFGGGKAPHPSPGVHGTPGSTFSHKGRREGAPRRPPRMPPFSPAWEKVSAQLTDEGAPDLWMRGRLGCG